jgi:hypothetical protein
MLLQLLLGLVVRLSGQKVVVGEGQAYCMNHLHYH